MPADVAVCAAHAERASVGTCTRCGRFVCAACLDPSPCPDCRALIHASARPPPRWLGRAIAALLVLHVAGAVTLGPAGRFVAIDVSTRHPSQQLITAVALGWGLICAFLALWAAAVLLFLVWYGLLLEWAVRREATRVHPLIAVALWFVPGVGAVHAYRTLHALERTVGASAGVRAWWVALAASGVAWVGLLAQFDYGGLGHTPVWVWLVVCGLDLLAAVLCLRVIRAFTLSSFADTVTSR